MNTKQIQTTLNDLQRRLERLEKQNQPIQRIGRDENVERRLAEIQRESDDRRLQILRRTAGALSGLDLDPVDWQKRQREQWGKRMKRQLIASSALEWNTPLITMNKKDFKGIPELEFYDL